MAEKAGKTGKKTKSKPKSEKQTKVNRKPKSAADDDGPKILTIVSAEPVLHFEDGVPSEKGMTVFFSRFDESCSPKVPEIDFYFKRSI